MEYDVERKAIEVQKKIFFDDFEVALKKKNKLNKFDILDNNWKLDKFPEKITEAHLMCTGKPDKIFKG